MENDANSFLPDPTVFNEQGVNWPGTEERSEPEDSSIGVNSQAWPPGRSPCAQQEAILNASVRASSKCMAKTSILPIEHVCSCPRGLLPSLEFSPPLLHLSANSG